MKYFIQNEETSQKIWQTYQELFAQNNKYQEVLTLIAAPIRTDGTWNRDRDACYELAIAALKYNN